MVCSMPSHGPTLCNTLGILIELEVGSLSRNQKGWGLRRGHIILPGAPQERTLIFPQAMRTANVCRQTGKVQYLCRWAVPCRGGRAKQHGSGYKDHSVVGHRKGEDIERGYFHWQTNLIRV